MLNQLINEIRENASKEKSVFLQRFFKTGKGQYGEGDQFLGLTVPQQRVIAKTYLQLSLDEIKQLLSSSFHEYRLIGLFILIAKFEKAKETTTKKQIFDFYLENRKGVNNWDLVDLTAPKIVGEYLLMDANEKKILYEFAKSANLWDKRIAIIATFAFIRKNQFEDTLKISEILLKDKHDLIHKAVGWMLREVGKKNQAVLEEFLGKYAAVMPRTALRYSIEKFDENKRKKYMGMNKI